MEPAISTSVANFEELFRVNTLGPVVLFQAFYDLLLKSEKPEKKFLITSSFAGSSSLAPANPFPVTAYGASKAAVNFVAVKLASEHGEKDKIAVVPIHPGQSILVLCHAAIIPFVADVDRNHASGLVSSDMGNDAMAAVGIDPKAALPLSIKLLSPPESAEALKALVDIVTVESHGGKFMNYDGTGIPW
jgi:NAD(P)-dependent dehydrogenase (short-subunit alcohol dehydrogenase family)